MKEKYELCGKSNFILGLQCMVCDLSIRRASIKDCYNRIKTNGSCIRFPEGAKLKKIKG